MTLPDTLALATSALTALVGLFVAYQAYRGYRRNRSEKMRALAVGIVLITGVPALLLHVVPGVIVLSDAQTLAGVLLSHTIGLFAIYRTLE